MHVPGLEVHHFWKQISREIIPLYKCKIYFFIFAIIITLTFIIVGANENALQKISCYPFIQF